MARPSLLRTRRIDGICGDFESAWRSGQRPCIEAIVPQADPADRSVLLAELVALEFELRLADGETVQSAEYLRRFPADENAVLTALAQVTEVDAAGAGVSSRQRAETLPDDERYCLGEQVGAGGMGVVFCARDPRLDRDLAVKVLAEPPADAARGGRAIFARGPDLRPAAAPRHHPHS